MTRIRLLLSLLAALLLLRAPAVRADLAGSFPPPPPPCPSNDPCLASGQPVSVSITPKIVRVGDTITITASRNDGQALSMNWGVDHLELAEKHPFPQDQPAVYQAPGMFTQVGPCPTTATSCTYRIGFVPTPSMANDTQTYTKRYWLAVRFDNSNQDYFGIFGTIVQGHVIHAGSTDVRSLLRFTMHDDTDTFSSYALGPKQVNNDPANFFQMVLPERTFEIKVINSHVPACLTTPSKFFFVNGDPVQTIDFVCGTPTLGAALTLSKTEIEQGSDVTVTLTVTNPGPGRVTNITAPTNLTLGGANPTIIEKKSGPDPSAELGIDEGAHQDFTWVYHAKGNGNLKFSASVDGKTSTLATIHSNTASVDLKVLNSATLTTDTIVEAYEGRTLTYEGKGFDPDGGDITITFNNEPVKTESAAAEFKGTFQVPPYPPITIHDVATGKPRCEARVRATQGETTAYADVKAPSGEVVYYADGVSYENGTPLSSKEWTFLCRNALLHDAGGHPLFASNPFSGGNPGILLTTNLNDRVTGGRPGTEKPPEGRLNRLTDPYGAFLVQACFEDHSTVSFLGANPYQLFIGEALVLDTGLEKAGPISVLRAPISFVASDTYGLLSTNGFQFAPATPPENDHDSDGIENAIDGDIVRQGQQTFFTPMPETFSWEFSNVNLGGNIGGAILQRDGVTLHFSGDAASVSFRAHVVVGNEGRERRATFRVCGSAARAGEGDGGAMSCGSLILHATEGEPAIVLGVDAEVLVPAGATVEVTEIDPTHVSVASDPSSAATATIVEDGVTTPVAPGGSVSRTVAPDHDGDGVADDTDGCQDDPAKGAPGACGCGNPDVDGDGDGALDCQDGCPFDASKLTPDGTCGCNCCEPTSKPKVTLGKILPPAGDDTLAVQATFALPPGAVIDPLADGFQIGIGDPSGSPITVTIPGGAYDKATKTGWKVNKKHTAWSFKQPKGAPGGTYAASITRNKNGSVTVKLSGKAGTFAAAPPLVLTARFKGGFPCGTSRFDVGKQACALKGKGKSVSCK